MNHSSPLCLFSMMMLGLLLGLLPQSALLLLPDSAALSSLAEQLPVDPAGDACSWDGITCEASRVVGISLGGYNLTGTLPEAWGQLSKVTYIDLSSNMLTGPLPDSWQAWTNVTYFDLNNNQLTGPLPDSWQTWTNVTYFDLGSNMLTGPLLDSWRSWTSVTYVDLSFNQLTGPLKDFWQSWTNMGVLDLSFNQLTGPLPSSWQTWTNVTYFDLSNNTLTGPLPDSWQTWTNVTNFGLSSNQLSGPVPDSWQTWTKVTYFDLSKNQLIGPLADSWQTWTKMGIFDLGRNQLTGPLPDSWQTWTNVTFFELNNNQLTGPLPDSWQTWTDVIFLSISDNKLTGPPPDSWKMWTKVFLSLEGNKLIGTLPDVWQNWTQLALEYLDLGDNMLSGSLPQAWSNMTSLEYISLAQNVFSSSMPSTWIASTVVKYVNFGGNNLSSSIPKLAAGLQLLDMSSNALSKLSYKLLPDSLEVLRLGNNKLAGGFPDATLLPANLTILDLSYNLLTGSLPVALPSKLAVLNATHNKMNGTLPAAWHVPLAEARLGSNKFEGKLPASWSQYGKNTSNSLQLSMVDTEIRGPMPQPWVQQFCLAIVSNSSTRVLFSPRTITISNVGDVVGRDISVALGSTITLAAQHASINVTLSGDEYTFDYLNPGSLCSIPHAQRNVAIFWGIFGAIFAGATVGITFWLRRQVTLPVNKKLTILAYASSAVNHKKARVPKRIAAVTWFCLTDVLWTLYSQVTDAITIHQVFGSGQLRYAYLLLAILLLPFLCIFFLVAIISVRHCLASTYGQKCALIPLNRIVHNLAAIVGGVLFAPVLFVVLEAALLTEGFGFTIAESLVPTALDLSSFYRANTVAEAFLNALPQAVVQTKLYLMGNDPNGIHVYINTTLFCYSVAGSALSVLKTVLLMITELYQFRCSLVTYFRKLMMFETLDDQGTAVSGQQASSAMGKTSSGTMLLPQSSVQLATLQCI
ncbi:hypothetical protein ABBQ38_015298 [Trebouxia sp. C0009 RCD-2024]